MISFSKYLLVFILVCRSTADPLGNFCNNDSTTQKSANTDKLLTELVSQTTVSGYYSTSYGKGGDRVYGLAQCRGDVSRKDCSNCLQDAANEIIERCSNQSDARIWYDYCFLRYSNVDFVGKVDTSFGIYYFNVENVTEPDTFNKELADLMNKIRSQAVVVENQGLGKGKSTISEFVSLYGLVQCTRDLAQIDCAQCLAIAVGNFPRFCSNRKGCRVLYSSCYVRYELYPFFFPLDSNNTMVDGTTKATGFSIENPL